jgi:hypothetical protein
VVAAVVALAVVVAAAVVVLVVFSTRNSAAAKDQARAAALAQMSTYSDYENSVSFLYPTSWDQISLDDVSGVSAMPGACVVFGESSGYTPESAPAGFMVFGAQEDPDGASVPTRLVLETTIQCLEVNPPSGFKVVEPVADVCYGGTEGAVATFAFEEENQVFKARFCFLRSGRFCYMFMFAALKQDWEKNEYFFDATLASFSTAVAY